MSEWYYAADNEQKGPVNEAELKENLATHKLPADTLVWKDGMENWTPANQVPAFSFRAPPAPAKVQPTGETTPAASEPKQPAEIADAGENPDEPDFNDAEKNKVYGILAYVGILFIVPLLAAKDSPFAKYHANQGFVLFLAMFVGLTALAILTYVPVIGFIFGMLHILLYLLYLVLVILGVVNASNGKCAPLPVIGGFKLLK